MKYLIALLFFFVFIDNEPNYSGKYCCENNCGNIIFIKPDKICIHELIGGHVLAYGFGNYKFIDKLIIVEYRHARKDSVYLIKKQINSDSLTIIIKDYWTKEVLPGANVELPNQYISKLTDLNGKVIFPKLHDNIVCTSPPIV